MTIYQTYHKDVLKKYILNVPWIKPYFVLGDHDDININYLHPYINEFSCLYSKYINKSHNDNDVIGFCHYSKIFNIKDSDIPDIENNVLNNGMVYGLGTYNTTDEIKNVLMYKEKENDLYIKIYDFLKAKYPHLLERFVNTEWDDKLIRFESYICKFSDHCNFVKFVLDFFNYHNLNLEEANEFDIVSNLNNFIIDYYNQRGHRWYYGQHWRKLSFMIEVLCAIYWKLIDKRINIIGGWKNNSFWKEMREKNPISDFW